MRVIKRINNNVILVSDNNQKAIVMGNGIGFNVYPKDIVSKYNVEQTFILKEDITIDNFVTLMNEVPLEIITLSHKIIENGREIFGENLNENLIVTLSDHIYFAIARMKDAISVEHPLLWEIKHVYHLEYKFGLTALKLIYDTIGVQLPDDEGAFIAMHFVTAQMNVKKMRTAFELTDLMNEIIHIIEYHFQMEIDKNSFHFSRFMTHLRYFLLRQLNGKSEQEVDNLLVKTVEQKYVSEHACIEKIAIFLKKKNGWLVDNNEKLYLTLHINRLVNENLI